MVSQDQQRYVDLTSQRVTSQIIETTVRAVLAVSLYAAFPPFSDIYRLWRRSAGIVPSELGSAAFEYPPFGTLFVEALSWLPSARVAVVVNGVLMALVAVAVTRLLNSEYSRRQGVDPKVWIASPALLLMLPINLDALPALLLLMAVFHLDADRPVLGGGLVGAGALLKIFPGGVVLPFLALLRRPRNRGIFLAASLGSVAAAYAIYAIVQPENWLTHVEFASVRDDFGSSLWGVIDALLGLFGGGLSVSTVNGLATGATAVSLLALAVWAYQQQPTFAHTATLAVVVLLAFNKISKPQYVLWLLPLLALIGSDRRRVRTLEATSIVDFAVIYFVLPSFLVPLSAAIRTGVLASLAARVVRRARPSSPTMTGPATGLS